MNDNPSNPSVSPLPSNIVQDNEGKSITANFVTSEDVEKIDKELRKEIDKTKENIITNFVAVLGIFASVVTFLLVEIQILKNVCDFTRLLGFSAFILGGLLGFIMILLFSINRGEMTRKSTIFILIVSLIIFLLFIMAYFAVWKGKDEYVCRLTTLNESFDSFQQKLNSQNKDRVDALENRLKLMEDRMSPADY